MTERLKGLARCNAREEEGPGAGRLPVGGSCFLLLSFSIVFDFQNVFFKKIIKHMK